MGFGEAEEEEATQEVTLRPDDWAEGTASIALRFVKFQNVISLVLFVLDGEGAGERVRIDRVRVVGVAGQKQGKLVKSGDA
jgi:hypothetical protein